MDRITDILAEKDLTKSALARLLGTSKQNINTLLRNPTRAKLEEIAAALNVPTWQLFVSPEKIREEIQSETGADGATLCPHCGHPLKINIAIE